MRYLISAVAAVVAAIPLAAPAAADADEFVRKVQAKWVYLSADQVMTAGNQACAALRSGVPASVVIDNLNQGLGVSVLAAQDIVSTAVVELGC
ncbi:Protein of uncharacterised function (DUF732) [Mycolicibacterium phlei]|jgi:hypothetical protein|uniref:DUF732 domain-containing protein n=1 Tax=Mycolicibacterium phlei DSM 43239 = CCUG 21000 TaxID=1226750 RepID=A0A5N5V6H2_MYCPH|nr:DUF732 domain-containing protein [Mycolicibacterium phlei]VEG11180.1 Protein of uncharacterised function (DUF732) [Mycobacteroides chelonae]AMO63082.1 hypothetical protein MPHLCCUG_04294 [Mycolicibacterium phlei]EID17310.1 hypothetical protein MPHLEI_04298 [Mycolicibacterium phlei RIVM601174]KAB7756089.1 hypothetical protein MPHL21000_12570 [Mycolicibacterium phlei DSM 43239 = CCUG 21000]KXW65753.1 hypothetical protein MPHL43239_10035 [Mycolicibacterium phlei DSM 43239 = CCUG 21000]